MGFFGFGKSSKIVESSNSTTKLFVILFGTAAVLFSFSMVLDKFYPIFDDLHDSEDSDDSE